MLDVSRKRLIEARLPVPVAYQPVDLFDGLLHHTDVMAKWRRKSLFCEPCGTLFRTWRG